MWRNTRGITCSLFNWQLKLWKKKNPLYFFGFGYSSELYNFLLLTTLIVFFLICAKVLYEKCILCTSSLNEWTLSHFIQNLGVWLCIWGWKNRCPCVWLCFVPFIFCLKFFAFFRSFSYNFIRSCCLLLFTLW